MFPISRCPSILSAEWWSSAHIHWCLRAAEFWPPQNIIELLVRRTIGPLAKHADGSDPETFHFNFTDQKGWCQDAYKIWDPYRRLQFHSPPVEAIFCLLAPGLTPSQARDMGPHSSTIKHPKHLNASMSRNRWEAWRIDGEGTGAAVRGLISASSRFFHPKVITCKTILRHCDDMMILPIIDQELWQIKRSVCIQNL